MSRRGKPDLAEAPAAPADRGLHGPAAPRIDALQLLRLVHIRRELRLTWHVASVAAIGWLVLNIAVEGRVGPGSVWYDRAEAIGLDVFLLLLAVFVAALLAQLLLRLAGTAGRAAAGLVPTIGVPDQPMITDGWTAMAGLWPRLRRRGYVSYGGFLLLLLFTFGAVASAIAAGPAWQADHGHGGRVVVIGQDARIAYSEERVTRGGTRRDYYLDTPGGTVIAEDGKPEPGQRWVVVGNPLGRSEAYRVGAHDYAIVAVCFVFFVLFDLITVVIVGAGVFAERGRRRSAGHTPLADSVSRLASGERARFAAGRVRLTMVLATQTYGRQTEYEVGLGPLGTRTPQRVLGRRRWTATAAAVAVVLAAGGAVTAYARHRSAAPRLQDRTVELAELAGSGWQPSVFADYSEGASGKLGFADAMREAGGGTLTASWTVLVKPARARQHGMRYPAAYIDVYRTRDIRPARLISALLVCTAAERCAPLRPLPAGWRGWVRRDAEQPQATVVAVQPGTVVSVSVDGNESGTLHLSVPQLQQVVTRLTAALTRIGVVPFAARTANS